jgi:hypothetical protein
MKPTELRIGNLVKNNEPRYGNKILVIESIGDNDTVNVFFREYPMSALEPIPLTEEWVLKFGFESLENTGFFRKYYNDKYYILSNPKQQYTEICVNSICGGQSKTQYVHQLQNLYFALTGEELTLEK